MSDVACIIPATGNCADCRLSSRPDDHNVVFFGCVGMHSLVHIKFYNNARASFCPLQAVEDWNAWKTKAEEYENRFREICGDLLKSKCGILDYCEICGHSLDSEVFRDCRYQMYHPKAIAERYGQLIGEGEQHA